MKPKQIVLVGGSGVVGSQVADILKRRMPQCELIIAGRVLDKAQAVAARVGAKAVQMDVNAPVLPAMSGGSADGRMIVGLTNDLHDNLLKFALNNGLPYVDITRWTERLKQALVTTAGHGLLKAPVVFASAWMGSVAGLGTRYLSASLSSIDTISIDILFAVADQAGPNSTAYMDRISEPFFTLEKRQWHRRNGMLDGHEVHFHGAGRYKTYRFDTPDQSSLPQITGAATVDARIGFDDRKATALLHFLVRSGIWKLLSRPAFDKLRQSILYNPGAGDAHRIQITVKGHDVAGKAVTKTLHITDPAGQTHLTALGAVLQIENLLRPDAPPAGSYLGEAIVDPAYAYRQLEKEGVLFVEQAL